MKAVNRLLLCAACALFLLLLAAPSRAQDDCAAKTARLMDEYNAALAEAKKLKTRDFLKAMVDQTRHQAEENCSAAWQSAYKEENFYWQQNLMAAEDAEQRRIVPPQM